MLEYLPIEDFVEYCYTNILGRPPDEDGKVYYINKLKSGSSRLDVIYSFINSDEYKKKSLDPFVTYAPPGHYYSPLPESETIEQLQKVNQSKTICGIDLNEEEQVGLLKSFSKFYSQLPWNDENKCNNNMRYFLNNPFYSYGDGIILYSFINYYKPNRIIEIGSGYSSAAILDTCEMFLKNKTKITFIEPYPNLLLDVLLEKDNHEELLVNKKVEDVNISLFKELQENDILFVDSSHVVKFSSDVLFILTEVLPVLKCGVIIHFHDIFWPFEYPLAWLKEGRAWNEAYFLRSFLMYNDHFKIIYFNDFIGKKYKNLLETYMPLCLKNHGCGFWIMKVK